MNSWFHISYKNGWQLFILFTVLLILLIFIKIKYSSLRFHTWVIEKHLWGKYIVFSIEWFFVSLSILSFFSPQVFLICKNLYCLKIFLVIHFLLFFFSKLRFLMNVFELRRCKNILTMIILDLILELLLLRIVSCLVIYCNFLFDLELSVEHLSPKQYIFCCHSDYI